MSTDDPVDPPPPAQRSLWRHHDFRQLWMGDTVSVFGNQFVLFALPLIAVQLLAADAFEMGLLAALENAAFLLISCLPGPGSIGCARSGSSSQATWSAQPCS